MMYFIYELADPPANLVSRLAKDLPSLVGRSLNLFRIEQTPMQNVASKRPHRRFFSRNIAYRYDIREVLLKRLLKLLAALPGYVNSNFPHNVTSQRVDFNRLRRGADGDEFVACDCPEKTFCDLTSC